MNERRGKAEAEAANDLKKQVPDLLVDVHEESLYVPMDRPYEQTVVRTTARFASLLALLAKRAEAQQKSVIALTIALLIFTVGLVFVGIAQLRSSYVLEDLMRRMPPSVSRTNTPSR